MKRSLLIISAGLVIFSVAQAHPTGHEGGLVETARHILTQPYHMLMMGGAVALLAVVVLATKRSRAAKK